MIRLSRFFSFIYYVLFSFLFIIFFLKYIFVDIDSEVSEVRIEVRPW